MAESGLRDATTFPAAINFTLSATAGKVTRVFLPAGKFKINILNSVSLNGGSGTTGVTKVVYDQAIADDAAISSEAVEVLSAETSGTFQTAGTHDDIPYVSIGGDTASMHIAMSAERIG